MFADYENYLDRIQEYAIREGYDDFQLAREEFHQLTGTFEDGEPWFDLRMSMFQDWFLLDRKGPSEMTPLEKYLTDKGPQLKKAQFNQLVYLTVSLRSVFKIKKIIKEIVLLDDLAGGGQWLVEAIIPIAGLRKLDIVDTRIFVLNGRLVMGSGTVLHPQGAHETIERIVARSKTEGMSARELVDHLDKMRLKLDRYSNVRVQHVYQYPGDAIL